MTRRCVLGNRSAAWRDSLRDQLHLNKKWQEGSLGRIGNKIGCKKDRRLYTGRRPPASPLAVILSEAKNPDEVKRTSTSHAFQPKKSSPAFPCRHSERSEEPRKASTRLNRPHLSAAKATPAINAGPDLNHFFLNILHTKYGEGGYLLCPSIAFATRSIVASSKCPAITCTPIGKPSVVSPHGTLTPQIPARLAATE